MKSLDCFACSEPVDYPVSNDTTRALCTCCTMTGATKPGRYFPRTEQTNLNLEPQPEEAAA